MEKKEIEFKVFKCFSEKESRSGKVRLQVVQWGKNRPALEKREFYIDDTDIDNPGKEKSGKIKGIIAEDLEVIAKNLDEIKNLLKA